MAYIYNFGLRGVASDVQFGKDGGRVVYDSGNSLFKVTTDGTTLGNMNVAMPTLDDHAATKRYVDQIAEGLDIKESCRASSTGANVDIALAPSALDGVTLVAGDRVLVKDQTIPAQNGIYVFNGTGAAMTRAVDMDASGEFTGSFFFVEEGTLNSDQGYVVTTNGIVTPDASPVEFTQFTGTGQITAGTALSKSGNTLNVNVDDTYIKVDLSDQLTVKGTTTTGQVLKSDGSSGVVYGAVDLANASAVSGILPLANGGLGVEAVTPAGKLTARTNLGLGTMATQDANAVNITGGTVDLSGGTLTLANDQLSGDKISGGTIDSANLLGTAGNTLSGYDITVGAGKTLDVDGVLDVDGAAGSAIDNVAVGTTTSAAGVFTTMASDSVDINGGTIDATVVGGTTPAQGTFTNANVTGTFSADTIDSESGAGITFADDITGGNATFTGTFAINALETDTINESTVGAGVTVDGVLLQDGGVTATGSQSTFSDAVLTTADINGGTADAVTIGGTVSAAGTFSTMTTAAATITGGGIAGTDVDMTGEILLLDNDQISGDKVHGGVISQFSSTGITDTATTSTQMTLTDTEATFANNVVVTGDLTVQGAVTSIETTNTTITDNIITLNDGEAGAGVTSGFAGLEVDRGTLGDATLLWNETTDTWEFRDDTNLSAVAFGSLEVSAIDTDTINSVSGLGIAITDDITVTGDIDASGTMTIDTINEHTNSVGVTVDGVLLQDGVVTGGLTAELGDTVDVTAATLLLANDQISGDKIEGGTIAAITISSLTATSADINGGTVDGTVIGATSSAAGTFTLMTADTVDVNGGNVDGTVLGATVSAAGTFSTMTTTNADIDGGTVDATIIGATTSAAGTFSTLNSANAQITGGDITGANITTSNADINGGTVDGTVIGGSVSAAGTFSTLSTNSATITGGTFSGTSVSATTVTTGGAAITGGSISGTDVDMTGETLLLDNDQISGDKVHGGAISSANLVGSGANTQSGYNITVGSGNTLDVTSGTVLFANDQISGDKLHGGIYSQFESTGIDDNATATVVTLTDTTATFGVNGDFGANTLAAGASTLASLVVTGDAQVIGNLTVSGAVTTTLSETVEIEDSLLMLNSNLLIGDIPTEDSGIEVNRGAADNTAWFWDETLDRWTATLGAGLADAQFGDVYMDNLNLTPGNFIPLDMGGTGTDTDAYALDSLMVHDGVDGVTELAKGANNTVLKVNGAGTLGYGSVVLTTDVSGVLPIANGGTNLTAAGLDRQVLTSDGSAVAYEYVSQLRSATGVTVLEAANATSGTGEYIDFTNSAGAITMTARNAAGTGTVDMYLQGQNGGDVFIVGQSGEALIQGELDTDLTVAGGDSSAGNAGDLVLKGGNGSALYESGDVVIKGGTGGVTEGDVQIIGSLDDEIALFNDTGTAVDYFNFTNGTGGVELATAGDSADVNLTLAPQGTGLVIAPVAYDMSSGPDKAFATKDYVDFAVSTNVDPGALRVSFAANGSGSFAVGTMPNVLGKTYYVNKVIVKVTNPFTTADEIVVSDSSNTLFQAFEADLGVGGIYVAELGYETATTGGDTVTAYLQLGGAAAAPVAGSVIVTVEYKAL